jgi:hypothetical protein
MVGAFSIRCAIPPEEAKDRSAMEEKISRFITDIGEAVSRDEIIYGHLKGLLQDSEENYARFSMTIAGKLDILKSNRWDADAEASQVTFTLNVNSMIHTESEIAQLTKPLLEKYKSIIS